VIRAFESSREIAWLDRFYFLPPLALAVAMYAMGGWPWLIWGFCLPKATLAHATFCHQHGEPLVRFAPLSDTRRFDE
jgi:stearoyl-CoA desaturase (delta-9 desaturase)